MDYGWRAKHPYTEQLWQAARDIMEHDLDGENRAIVTRFQQDITSYLQDIDQHLRAAIGSPEDSLLEGMDKIANKVSPKSLRATIPLGNELTRRAVSRVVEAVRETLDEHIPSGVSEFRRAKILERLDETELAISQNVQIVRV